MKLIKKEHRKIFYGETLVGWDTIYIVDQLPKQGEYFEIGNYKGYVVDVQYDEEGKYYSIYYEDHLGDWYNQLIEVCNVLCIDKIKE